MSGRVTCPGCRREVPHVARCPECDYPLVLVPQSTQAPSAPQAPARRPGERPGEAATQVVPAPPPEPMFGPPPIAVPNEPTIICPDPYCNEGNPTSRTLCIRCGTKLRPDAVPAPLPAPPPPERSSRAPRIVAGVVAVLAVIGLGAWAGTSLLRGPAKPTPTTPRPLPTSQGAPAAAVPVSDVTATASSVQKRAGSITYAAANLLDGDPATAWNSRGGLAEQRGQLTVTFTFARAYDLRSVSVLNGYQKKRGGSSPLDLFVANARPSKVEVRTDTRKTSWTLQDKRNPQALDASKAPLGTTRTVTIVILGVYPGTKFADVALSEVSFTGVPVG